MHRQRVDVVDATGLIGNGPVVPARRSEGNKDKPT
jgi:hypothetical protein